MSLPDSSGLVSPVITKENVIYRPSKYWICTGTFMEYNSKLFMYYSKIYLCIEQKTSVGLSLPETPQVLLLIKIQVTTSKYKTTNIDKPLARHLFYFTIASTVHSRSVNLNLRHETCVMEQLACCHYVKMAQ